MIMTFRQFQKRLAGHIVALRARTGLTQAEAAKRARITRVHWQRLEGPAPNPTAETLHRVAGVFKMSLAELVGAVQSSQPPRADVGREL